MIRSDLSQGLDTPRTAVPSRLAKLIYVTLSVGAGVAEAAPLLISLSHSSSLLMVLLLGLAYQLGPLLATRHLRAMVAVAVGGMVAASLYLVLRSASMLLMGCLLLAVALQAARRVYSRAGGISTAAKRSARVAGFMLAGLASPSLLIAASVLVGVALIAALRDRGEAGGPVRERPPLKPTFWRVLMLVHQVHYFVYVYVLVWAFVVLYRLSSLLAALALVAGWVTYTVSPWLLRGMRPTAALIAGHVVNTCLIFMIALLYLHPLLALVLWVATGIGGGTVFGLRKLAIGQGDTERALDIWENLGHVAGALVSILCVTVGGAATPFFVGAGIALAVPAAVVVRQLKHVVFHPRHLGGNHA